MGEPEVKGKRVIITWTRAGIQIQGDTTNPETIAMLEMAKALTLQRTIGPATRLEKAGLMASAPMIARQVDKQEKS